MAFRRDQMTVIGAKKYAAIARVGALPIGHASVLMKMAWPVMARLRIELPNFFTGRGVERNDTICRRRKIKPIFDDKWSGFKWWNAMTSGAALLPPHFASVIHPGGFQLTDILRSDLGQ